MIILYSILHWGIFYVKFCIVFISVSICVISKVEVLYSGKFVFTLKLSRRHMYGRRNIISKYHHNSGYYACRRAGCGVRACAHACMHTRMHPYVYSYVLAQGIACSREVVRTLCILYARFVHWFPQQKQNLIPTFSIIFRMLHSILSLSF